ncbi:MAG: dihydroneopterin aldolase [Rhizomicrobium sp.]
MKKVAKSPSAVPTWSTDKGYMRMMIRDLVTEVRLGLHPWERHPEKPQRIVINVEMYATPQSGRIKGVTSIVDYDYVREAIRKWPRRRHTVFIETLLEELVKLCFRDKRVAACRVSIFKPDIYNEAAGAGVEIYRVRQ